MEYNQVFFFFFCDCISLVHEVRLMVFYRTPAVGVVIRLASILYACVNIHYWPVSLVPSSSPLPLRTSLPSLVLQSSPNKCQWYLNRACRGGLDRSEP